MTVRLLLWTCAAMAAGPVLAAAPPPKLFDNLGSYHRPISSRSKEAQAYFDQGLRLVFAFNHEEAQAAFEEAARLDPSCAICFWGAALTLGPNINLPASAARSEAAWTLLKKAEALAATASPVERALIGALARRYTSPPPGDPAKQLALDTAYASAMRQVAKRFPADPDVATLFAEAMMDLRPWDLWTASGKPQPGTQELVATLERVIRAHPDHPGANHYFIHAVEASPHPERALPSAERMKTLVPGAGHLVHMPSHVYIRTGRYAEGSEANRKAIAVDTAYAASHHDRPIYAMYVAHNFQFLWATSLMEGRSAESLQAARDMLQRVPLEMFKDMPGYDFLLAYPVMGLARFGLWKEVLQEPTLRAAYPTAQGLVHLARGLALTKTGDLTGAAREQSELEAILQRTPEDARVAMNSAREVLGIAVSVLAGELALARGDTATAIRRFEQAVIAEDRLKYDEPPDWSYPVRHQLGVALLAARRPAQAEAVYRADLVRHPNNGWALFGLAQSLDGQGKAAQAKEARLAFDEAWNRADVQLTASAF
jgi:tetratricopeptide (TPR) repeat protein